MDNLGKHLWTTPAWFSDGLRPPPEQRPSFTSAQPPAILDTESMIICLTEYQHSTPSAYHYVTISAIKHLATQIVQETL